MAKRKSSRKPEQSTPRKSSQSKVSMNEENNQSEVSENGETGQSETSFNGENMQIKTEPQDDYGEEQTTQGLEEVQVKMEPMEFEDASTGSYDANADYNYNQANGESAEAVNNGTENIQEVFLKIETETQQPFLTAEDSNSSSTMSIPEISPGKRIPVAKQLYPYYTDKDEEYGQEKSSYRNVSILPDDYQRFTGKQLTYPITKKMYEHFRYMRAKIMDREKFKCDLCTRTFPFRHELARHRLYHTGVKKHVCEVCGKTFVLKGQLTTHMLSHTRIRRFQCKYCPSSFLLGSHLRQHLPSHNPELRLKCDQCELTFTRKASLDRHVKRLHPKSYKWACRKCGNEPKSRSNGEGPQECDCIELKDYCHICNSRLGNSKNLTIHMKTFHPEYDIEATAKKQFPVFNSTAKIKTNSGTQTDKKKKLPTQKMNIHVGQLNMDMKKILQEKLNQIAQAKSAGIDLANTTGASKRKPYRSIQIKPNENQNSPEQDKLPKPVILNGNCLLGQGSYNLIPVPVPVQYVVNGALQQIVPANSNGLPQILPAYSKSLPTILPANSSSPSFGQSFIINPILQNIPVVQNVAETTVQQVKTAPTVFLKYGHQNPSSEDQNSIQQNESSDAPKNESTEDVPQYEYEDSGIPEGPPLLQVPEEDGMESYNNIDHGADDKSSANIPKVECIDPVESEVRKQQEINRVVTFKVEITEKEDQDIMDNVVTDIKTEPEEEGNDESDRFVVYKVSDDDPSIREGFYRALCIKQEIKEEEEEMKYVDTMDAESGIYTKNENNNENGFVPTSLNNSQPESNSINGVKVYTVCHVGGQKTKTTQSQEVLSQCNGVSNDTESSQDAVSKMESNSQDSNDNMADHSKNHNGESADDKQSQDSNGNFTASLKAVRSSRRKTSGLTLDSLLTRAIENQLS